MASNYWIKLYDEMLDDPKMGMLSDSAYRRCIELFLLAGRQQCRDGALPLVTEICWMLRVTSNQLQQDIEELTAAGILEVKDDQIIVKNFAKRQRALTPAEKQKRYRDRKREKLPISNQSTSRKVTKGNAKSNAKVTKGVTERVIDTDTDTDIDTNTPLTPQGGKRPKPKRKRFEDLVIPDHLNTPEFLTAWQEWREYRGNSMKIVGYQKALNKLSKFDPLVAAKTIEESMSNGWKGLFPENVRLNSNGSGATDVTHNVTKGNVESELVLDEIGAY
jgi:hypothetical protein